MNTPLNQNPPGMLDQGDQREHNCCSAFFCWLFQILLWAGIGMSVFLGVQGYQEVVNALEITGGIYVIYLILEFCSSTARYLCNKSTDQGIYEQMGTYFKTPPVINFHCECYHYVIRHHTRRTKHGVRHYTTRERVTTYREDYHLPYYSERDVSGLFILNGEKAFIEKKHYIKLKLKEEVNFADAISYMDYQYEKEYFWRRNRFRDVHFSFTETRTIPGLVHHNLVKLTAQEPCSVNFAFFFLFTIIPFVEFYKIYVDSFCVFQRYKVRKLVSTRYDLNQDLYQTFVPQMNLVVQQYDYQPDYYNYLNQDYQVKLPTEEELEKAKQYQSYVPDYQISSGGGGIQAGVIIDNPGYSSFNQNEAPAAFASVGGDVALDPSQVNANGEAPTGFGQPGFQFNIAPSNQTDGGYSSQQGNIYNNGNPPPQGQGQGEYYNLMDK